MKKQELIHLHGLLAEVAKHMEEEWGADIDTYEYIDLGVRPTSTHKSKSGHKDAIFALANGINDSHDHGTEPTARDSLEDIPENLREPYFRLRKEVNPYLKRDSSERTWYFQPGELSEDYVDNPLDNLDAVLEGVEETELESLKQGDLIELEPETKEPRVYLPETKSSYTGQEIQIAELV